MKSSTKFLSALMLASAAFTAHAVPAKPGLITIPQEDGTLLQVRLVGDEHFSMYLTPEGCPVLPDGKDFRYARVSDNGELVSTGVKVSAVDKRTPAENAIIRETDGARVEQFFNKMSGTAAPGKLGRKAPSKVVNHDTSRFLFANFPTKGSPRSLVILVRYQDIDFTIDDPHDYFTRMVTERGFSDNGATGSALDFFIDSSFGQFTPQFDVYGPVTLPKERWYYGGNIEAGGYGDGDGYAWKMVTEACELLDDQIDFSLYDYDNDGVVDNIYVFYAGVGQASSGVFDSVWPFAGNIKSYDKTREYVHDGMVIDHFAMSNEWVNTTDGTGGHPDGIGTFVHEFSHVLGLPDMYSTNYSNTASPGVWSTLDIGSYNNTSRTPPLYSVFERYSVGWLMPDMLQDRANVVLPPIDGNKGYMIETASADEFYLFENRQQTGWDAYLPGHGMLVWHIDFDQKLWNYNGVNNDGTHQRIDIVEADETSHTDTKEGDTFPGTSGKTSFTDDSKPSMKTWNGSRLSVPLTEITETENGYITFKVKGGYDDVPVPASPRTTNVGSRAFTIEWEPVSGADNYSVTVMDSKTFFPVKGFENILTGGATQAVITGLQPATSYKCCVSAVSGKVSGAPSAFTFVTTNELGFVDVVPVALEAGDVETSSFVAKWESVDAADGYLLTVFNKEQGEPYYFTEGFDKGATELPEGWSSSSRMSYSMASYAGKSTPSLRLSNNNDYLETCEYPEGVRSIKFWHRGNGSATPSNNMLIMGKAGDEWRQLSSSPVVKDAGGSVIELKDVPAGYTAFRIVYEVNASGSVAIDDVEIGYGSKDKRNVLAAYNAAPVGNVRELKVEGLEADTEYYYVVAATSEGVTSDESNEILVRTAKGAGVESVSASASRLRGYAEGNTIHISAAPGTAWRVLDLCGITVAEGTADSAGRSVVAGCSKGVLLLTDGNVCVKIYVK